MAHSIYINANLSDQVRVAALNGNQKVVKYFEAQPSSLKDSIFKARVEKWQKNLDAYFLDIGLGKSAFLQRQNTLSQLEPDQGGLSEGDYCLVQIVTDNQGSGKGPKVTESISLVSHFCALKLQEEGQDAGFTFPKDTAEDFQAGLVSMLSEVLSDENNVALRQFSVAFKSLWTARGSVEDVRAQYLDLATTMKQIIDSSKTKEETGLVYYRNSLLDSIFDLCQSSTQAIFIDNPFLYEALYLRLGLESSSLAKKISLHKDPVPLFEKAGIIDAIGSSQNREVKLPGGGSISIDPTEALTAIDVNSGKGTSNDKNMSSMASRVNIEAADMCYSEISRRQIGGLIVIDFIDMVDVAEREKVNARVKKNFASETKTVVCDISEVGLMQISRPRFNQTINVDRSQICSVCHGSGWGTNDATVINQILRKVESHYYSLSKNSKLTADEKLHLFVNTPPKFAYLLSNRYRHLCFEIEQQYNMFLTIHADNKINHVDEITISNNEFLDGASYALSLLKENRESNFKNFMKGGYDDKRSFDEQISRKNEVDAQKKLRREEERNKKIKAKKDAEPGLISRLFTSLFGDSTTTPKAKTKGRGPKGQGSLEQGKKPKQRNRNQQAKNKKQDQAKQGKVDQSKDQANRRNKAGNSQDNQRNQQAKANQKPANAQTAAASSKPDTKAVEVASKTPAPELTKKQSQVAKNKARQELANKERQSSTKKTSKDTSAATSSDQKSTEARPQPLKATTVKPAMKSATKPAAKSATKPDSSAISEAKPAAKPSSKPARKPTVKATDKANDKSSDKTTSQSSTKASKKPASQSLDKTNENTAEKSTSKPAVKSTPKPRVAKKKPTVSKKPSADWSLDEALNSLDFDAKPKKKPAKE